MEQIQLPEVQRHQYEAEATTGNCVNCESRAAEPGYTTNLCAECRKLFIKYPIPLWIKLFAGGVCLVILFSLFTFPDNLSTAIHLSRGKKAANNNKYVTVRNEMQKVLKKHPQHFEARAYLMIAAFYNADYDAFFRYNEELAGSTVEDEQLGRKLADVEETMDAYYSDDSVQMLQHIYDVAGAALRDSMLAKFMQRNPGNYSALFTYANSMFDTERYAACDSVMLILLEKDDTHIPALQLMARAKNMQKDYNAAVKYCERVLEINKESAYTYAMIARTYFKQRRDKEGLDMAYKAMSLGPEEQYVRATMALAYHFTHQFDSRDEMVKEANASKDSLAGYYFDYVNDVIANKEQFR